MDNIFKLIVLFLVIGWSVDSFAVPRLPGYSMSRSGATTTYTVESSTYTPISKAPTGTDLRPLNTNYSAGPTGYQTRMEIPIGDTIEAVKKTMPVSPASMAEAAAMFVRNPYFAAAVYVGSALYNYFHDAGMTVIPTGGAGIPPPSTVEPVANYSSGTWCPAGRTYSSAAAAADACLANLRELDNCAAGFVGSGCPNQVSSVTETTTAYYFVLKANSFQYQGTGAKTHTSSCPDGYAYSAGSCNIIGTPSPVPSSPSQIKDALIAHPPVAPQDVIAEIHDIDPSGNSDPVADGAPSIDLETGPMWQQSGPSTSPYVNHSPPKTSVMPDGRVKTEQDTTTLTKTSPTTFDATTDTITTINNFDGSTTTINTSNAPPEPPPDSKTDCDKYPDSIGCAEFGEAPASEVVQTVNVTATLNPTSLGAGSCPSPNVVHLSHGRTVTVSYQPECDLATGIAPIMIALAWLAAGMLVLSPVRG